MGERLSARLDKINADRQKMEQKKAELEKARRELEQTEHRLQRMENRQSYRRSAKDRARTRRLIQYGAAMESNCRELSILFFSEIYDMIERILAVDGVNSSRRCLKKRASERSSGIWKRRPSAGTMQGGSRHGLAAMIMTEDAKTEKYTAGGSCGAYIEVFSRKFLD